MNLPITLSGCEAVARGAWEGGADALLSYPGSPVTGIVDAARHYAEISTRWAANEKVALEIAAGVAYSGKRAVAVMKHVGVNVAADALFNLAYTGVRGALVVVVGDDPGASCSQNEQDTRLVAMAANIPVLEPCDANEALTYTRLAFEISHTYDLPVIVRMTTQLCYATQQVVTGKRTTASQPAASFAGPVQKFLLLPSHVPARHRAIVDALQRLQHSRWPAFFVQEHWPHERRATWPVGLVCAGHTYPQVLEHFDKRVPILQVGCSLPLPEARIRQFADQCDALIVTEECSNFLRDQIRALGYTVLSLGRESVVGAFCIEQLRNAGVPEITRVVDALVPPRRTFPVALKALDSLKMLPDAPSRPPGFCAGCSHVGAFDVLRRMGRHVVGDIGCYTLGGTSAFNALHSNLCMGASVGILQGYLMMAPAKRGEAIAVIGDSTFFHSGIPAVITAVNNRQRGTLLILDNSGTAMTGFQSTGPNLDERGWDKLLEALGVHCRAVVPALDTAAILAQISAFDSSATFAVIVLKGMCVQGRTQTGPTNFRYTVTASACNGCGECVTRTSCPSLVPLATADGQEVMSITSACIGCGLCSQTCPQDAIIPRTVSTGVPLVDRALGHIRWHKAIGFVRGNRVLSKVADRFERELA
jgi:indolepyruvate ferredoxin oxidoreductase, alpha subunit